MLLTDPIAGRTAVPGQRANNLLIPEPATLADDVWKSVATAPDVPLAVQQLEPSAPGYLRTEGALRRYLALADQGSDVIVPAKMASHAPDEASISALRLRLQQLGDLSSTDASTRADDALLHGALRRFQGRHGLAPTGIVDARTLRQLNVPIAKRIEQLSLTLERWRWVPHSFQEPPIVVNIPEFRVRAYDEHLNVVLSMPVIVGRPEHRKTPVLQARLTQIIFHPYWNVPRDIQDRELIPHIERSRDYLAAHDYEAVDHHGNIVRTGSITIAALKSGALRIRQVPGQKNALGAIKFVFPNGYDVYMHGTPEMSLFSQDRRAFSHGCIRLEDPIAMAVWVLRKEGGWSRDRIEAGVADPHTMTLALTHPIPVLVVYGTGFAAEDGEVRFFDDIYGYDSALEHVLEELSHARLAVQY
jgi:murein L,D-transpeptidase YcbB/YkuD